MATQDEGQLVLCLTGALDPDLFDESLTLLTEVPEEWNGCSLSQGGVSGSCQVVGTTARFDAHLGGGDITIGMR